MQIWNQGKLAAFVFLHSRLSSNKPCVPYTKQRCRWVCRETKHIPKGQRSWGDGRKTSFSFSEGFHCAVFFNYQKSFACLLRHMSAVWNMLDKSSAYEEWIAGENEWCCGWIKGWNRWQNNSVACRNTRTFSLITSSKYLNNNNNLLIWLNYSIFWSILNSVYLIMRHTLILPWI